MTDSAPPPKKPPAARRIAAAEAGQPNRDAGEHPVRRASTAARDERGARQPAARGDAPWQAPDWRALYGSYGDSPKKNVWRSEAPAPAGGRGPAKDDRRAPAQGGAAGPGAAPPRDARDRPRDDRRGHENRPAGRPEDRGTDARRDPRGAHGVDDRHRAVTGAGPTGQRPQPDRHADPQRQEGRRPRPRDDRPADQRPRDQRPSPARGRPAGEVPPLDRADSPRRGGDARRAHDREGWHDPRDPRWARDPRSGPPHAGLPTPRPARDSRHEGAPPASLPAPRPEIEGPPRPDQRLSKVLAERGLASRREADEWIEAGWVKVDGELAVLGARVLPTQRIEIDPAARTQQARRVTILLHKPVGYVSGQAEDGYEPASVLVTQANHWSEDPSRERWHAGHARGLAPAGRLDIDSTGLLVLTQDGRIARHLIGEDSEVEKEYLVRVETTREGPFPESDLELLRHGLSLDGRALQPAKVSWANEDQLRFVLREGRKRQIRRMCEAVGLVVTGLKRVRIGSVVLGKLPAGQWRYLREDERF
jgi:23S rRNA pseudouridine2604 synthase